MKHPKLNLMRSYKINGRNGLTEQKFLTLKSFRHSYATWAYRLTKDPLLTQRLMNHGSLATTQQYMHANREEIKQATEMLANVVPV
jgi:integrase